MPATLNIVLIDNGADASGDYIKLLGGHNVKQISFRNIKSCDFSNCHLVILSGGHSVNVSENIDEIEFIRKTAIPIIGICYGFQMLSFVYGAKIIELPEKRDGLARIVSKVNHQIFQGKKKFLVSEKHKFAVQDIPEKLTCLAYSEDGCEIIQVKGKQQFGLQFHPENGDYRNEGRHIFNNLVNFIFG